MGQFVKARSYPDASFRDVTAPNADTLYTTAWIDVGNEPWVLSIPDMKDRYFLFPMLDGWTTVFQVPGKRTTGTRAQTYAITGPDWKGTLPAGVQEYKSPTNMVWILGRIYCTGTPEDYKAVHELQDQCKLVPLSVLRQGLHAAGRHRRSVDRHEDRGPRAGQSHGRERVLHAAAQADEGQSAGRRRRGPSSRASPRSASCPARTSTPSKLNADFAKRIPSKSRFDRIMLQFKLNKDVKNINGWAFTTKTGIYGTDYLMRALVTAIGLGANRPQDAVYPTSQKDADDRAYDGANKYVMRFPRGQLPPVRGFWSVTMYDADYFFVANPLNRYSISPRQNLKTNPDGSTDLYIQKDSPGAGQGIELAARARPASSS